MDCFIIFRTVRDKWIVVCDCCGRAWSGHDTRFVPVNKEGLPVPPTEVKAFDTAGQAAEAASNIATGPPRVWLSKKAQNVRR